MEGSSNAGINGTNYYYFQKVIAKYLKIMNGCIVLNVTEDDLIRTKLNCK